MDATNLTRDQLVRYVDVFIVGLLRKAGLQVSVARTPYGRRIKIRFPGGWTGR